MGEGAAKVDWMESRNKIDLIRAIWVTEAEVKADGTGRMSGQDRPDGVRKHGGLDRASDWTEARSTPDGISNSLKLPTCDFTFPK